MGDPRKQRSKYETPNHPWLKERIETETALVREYGLKSKTEIWKMKAVLTKFKTQAKKITALRTLQSEKEKDQLLAKLTRLGLLPAAAQMDQVLALDAKDVLERRLQSIVFRMGLAKSMNQARQFIVHRHILLNGKKLTAPGFLVPKDLESTISFSPNSDLADPAHPERVHKVAEQIVEPSKEESAPEVTEPVKEKKAKKEKKSVKKEKGEE